MSWWGGDLTSFASAALKKAQDQIDKALDIPIEENESSYTASSGSLLGSAKDSPTQNERRIGKEKRERRTPKRSSGLTLGARRAGDSSPRSVASPSTLLSQETISPKAETACEPIPHPSSIIATFPEPIQDVTNAEIPEPSGPPSLMKSLSSTDASIQPALSTPAYNNEEANLGESHNDDADATVDINVENTNTLELFDGNMHETMVQLPSPTKLNFDKTADNEFSKGDDSENLLLEAADKIANDSSALRVELPDLIDPSSLVSVMGSLALPPTNVVLGDHPLVSPPSLPEEPESEKVPASLEPVGAILESSSESTLVDQFVNQFSSGSMDNSNEDSMLIEPLSSNLSEASLDRQSLDAPGTPTDTVISSSRTPSPDPQHRLETTETDGSNEASITLEDENIPAPSHDFAESVKDCPGDDLESDTISEALPRLQEDTDDKEQRESQTVQQSFAFEESGNQAGEQLEDMDSGKMNQPALPAIDDRAIIEKELDSQSESPDVSSSDRSPPTNELIQSTCSDGSYVKCSRPLSWVDSADDLLQKAATELSDLDTVASSDIEIISLASTYETNSAEHGLQMDFMPLGRPMFKTAMRGVSPDGLTGGSQSSPGSEAGSEPTKLSGSDSSRERSESDAQNPLSIKVLLKKVSQLTEILEVREKKLLESCKENSELHEVNNHLKQRIEYMEERNGDLDTIKSEFGQRLQVSEQKLNNAIREKESIKKQLLHNQEEIENRKGLSGKLQKIIEEKDDQISQLIEEGEKLSKQQLQSNNLIKKLRKNEKEHETAMQAQSDLVSSQKAEIVQLSAQLAEKATVEIKHLDLIKQLKSNLATQTSAVEQLKAELEDHQQRSARAESAVDKSYKEVASLHQQLATKQAEITQLQSASEVRYQDEMQSMMQKQEKEALKEVHHLTNQIEDMQVSAARMEKDGNRREEMLRHEISDLIAKLELSEGRNTQLGESITSATRPLVRQIENLQQSLNMQQLNWERSERQLMTRLADAQGALTQSEEDGRHNKESLIQYESRVKVLESQALNFKQEKATLQTNLAQTQQRLNDANDELNKMKSSWADLTSERDRTLSLLRREIESFKGAADMEKDKLEIEKGRNQSLTVQMAHLEQQMSEMSSKDILSRGSSPLLTDAAAVSTPSKPMLLSEVRRTARQASLSNMYETARLQGSTVLMEGLEAQVKQKDGEIVQLQAELIEHERTRESLTNEMLKLTSVTQEQENKIEKLLHLDKDYKDLGARYNALLQMYGEKEEEVRELRLDLLDVKQMYKQQIDQLLSK